MRFLLAALLAVLVAAVRHRTWRPRPYVGRHSYDAIMDKLWQTGLAELAARRRAMGWA